MRTGILTYYNVHNHGAVLQANALRAVIMSLGHPCEFLTFNRDYSMISPKSAVKYKIGLDSIPFYIQYLREKGIGNIFYNIKKKHILNEYRKKNLQLGERYDCFQGDIIVIGSDEVFSIEIGINSFLYGNGLRVKQIISYAGSFGPTTEKDIEKKHLEKMLLEGFSKMNAISVRDENSQKIVKKFSNKEAYIVCDPVILYGFKKEMELFRPTIKNYIVIYSYDKNMNSTSETEKIIEYAKINNLKVVSVGYYHRWCKSIQASPEELLGWINNAKLIVTDTFHGAVMSIICNTPMVVKIRGNKNKLSYLLEEYGLENRIVNDFSELNQVAGHPIDFKKMNELVSEHREKSMTFLQNVFGSYKYAESRSR